MPVVLVFLIAAAVLGLVGLLIRVLAVLLVGAAALVAHPIQTTLRILQYGCAIIGGLAVLFALLLWFGEPHDKPLRLISSHAYPYPVGFGMVIGVIVLCGVLSSLFGRLADRPSRAERKIMDTLRQPQEQVVRVVHEFTPTTPPAADTLPDRQIIDTTAVDTTDTYLDSNTPITQGKSASM